MNLTCSVGYSLLVHVQKDEVFGLSLTLCTIFKYCSQFSENASFEKFVKNSFSSEIATFWVFFSLVRHAVNMHTVKWLKIWLKKTFFLEKNAVLRFIASKTKQYQTSIN